MINGESRADQANVKVLASLVLFSSIICVIAYCPLLKLQLHDL